MSKKFVPCRSCIEESPPGYIKKIDNSGREILIECDCHKQWRENRLLISRLKEASLPFSKFMLSYRPDKDYIGDSVVLQQILTLPQLLHIAIDMSYLIYFLGERGTQKTTAGQWVGISLIRKTINVCYISMQKLIEGIITNFGEESFSRKKYYETVQVLIIDDSFNLQRIALFKNKNYQLAPLNTLLRNRSDSSEPRHTIIISDTPVGSIAQSGFGKDIEYFIYSRATVVSFPDKFRKEKARFDPRDIFRKDI